VVGAAAAPSSDPHYELEPAASGADIPVPEYGTVAWVINSCLMLIGSRAFEYGELKKAMLQAVIIVITGNGAKYNEPVLFMRIMVSTGGEGGERHDAAVMLQGLGRFTCQHWGCVDGDTPASHAHTLAVGLRAL
jgi:hypothetical protein